jgi:hypothetical protein
VCLQWLPLCRPRLTATSLAWVANDFAFYGNKLFQSTFIALLYPQARTLAPSMLMKMQRFALKHVLMHARI